jgi:hypothetical protein
MNSKLSKLFIRQQLDESTNAANVASNFIFNRYTRNVVKELSYFCKLSESTTTGSDSKKRCYASFSVTVFVFLG